MRELIKQGLFFSWPSPPECQGIRRHGTIARCNSDTQDRGCVVGATNCPPLTPRERRRIKTAKRESLLITLNHTPQAKSMANLTPRERKRRPLNPSPQAKSMAKILSRGKMFRNVTIACVSINICRWKMEPNSGHGFVYAGRSFCPLDCSDINATSTGRSLMSTRQRVGFAVIYMYVTLIHAHVSSRTMVLYAMLLVCFLVNASYT